MPNREKVIKGLEESYQAYLVVEGRGVLVDSDENEYALIAPVLIRDALALLKAQEPRVMSEAEVAAWNHTKRPIREPVYVEHRDSGEVFAHSIWFGGTWDYGVTWRCWTSRPTDEQREAVKWDA